ncbi:hypothetical protein VOLCADRAFT_85899 [Volvox carteri f. nagariensis]|uniref:Rhodanese domain-containing protein n=1 Tax=Volvox carteri f. nagariensis TaxID=3068 RepID=D8THA6_VOLCA|nr:uncharacterized protein VOLCADRAFT_85899 [Volvox carteri f. nagariensis]EFJ52677.1 hypothetical protein VOLCADRAFT_85899 [Volvox carteri f. nagariensis]|eukprot:XP_002945682.1 hypothetical protein VOLCADRAFT_85899 [Volvox carteri f. nagariensis]
MATVPSPGDSVDKLDELYEGFRSKFPDVPEVTVQQLHGWMNAAKAMDGTPPVVVDVRTRDEQQVSMLPGPDTMTQRQFEERGPDYFRGRSTAGYRSGLFADKLRRKHGLEAYNLRGSILAWTQAGYPLADPRDGKPTDRVHVFSKDWSLQGEGYVPVTFRRSVVPLVLDAAGGLWESVLRLLSGRRGKAT